MSVRPDLKSRLSRAAGTEAQMEPQTRQAQAPSYQDAAPARRGKVMVAGYFSPELARAVKIAAAEEGVTVQALVGEGLDLVLRGRGKHAFGER